MTEKGYNLLDEAWIVVMDQVGNLRSVGLKEAFRDAHEIRSISGDTPAQDLTVLRLMLAVLYSAYLHDDSFRDSIEDEDDAYDVWDELWSEGRFDTDRISNYMEKYRDRFYLFHDQRPFYQSPIDKGTEYGASKLNGMLSESGNKPRLFTMVSGVRKNRMDYADAARWLLYVNAYDDTSSKPTVRGGDMPSPGAGWMGKMGLVYIQGHNLFETLMLNMPLCGVDGEPFQDGVAIWERDAPKTEERVEIPFPDSPVELLTLQSRRILLKRDGDYVTGYLLLGGDVVSPESAFLEQMTEWNLRKDNTWVPRRHDPSRALWRDFASLTLDSQIETKEKRKPGVVRWMSGLVERGKIDTSAVCIRAAGVKYGDKDFFVDDLVDDGISFSRNLLAGMNSPWVIRIDDVIQTTDRCVGILAIFSMKIAEYNRIEESVRKKTGSISRAEAYSRLDMPFRSWLSTIEPGVTDMEASIFQWMEKMRNIILEIGQEYLDNASHKSLKGNVDGKNPLDNNIFTAFKFFKIQIFKLTSEGE